MTLRLLIVDDNTRFLEAARTLLEREGLSVVGLASTSADAARGLRELRPDIMLVDIDLGDESGFDLARQLTEMTGGEDPVRVVLISAYPEADLGDLVDASPAIGFLSKSQLSRRALDELLGGRGLDARLPS